MSPGEYFINAGWTWHVLFCCHPGCSGCSDGSPPVTSILARGHSKLPPEDFHQTAIQVCSTTYKCVVGFVTFSKHLVWHISYKSTTYSEYLLYHTNIYMIYNISYKFITHCMNTCLLPKHITYHTNLLHLIQVDHKTRKILHKWSTGTTNSTAEQTRDTCGRMAAKSPWYRPIAAHEAKRAHCSSSKWI